MRVIEIGTNNIYNEINDILTEKELSMLNLDNSENVKYEMNKLIENSEYINYKYYKSIEEGYKTLCEESETTTPHLTTKLLQCDDEYTYECIYIENEEENLNELTTLSNIDMEAINGRAIIIKTDNDRKIVDISKKDLTDLIYNNFYHKGLMINTNNDIKELIFTTSEPVNTIGTTFKTVKFKELLGIYMVIHVEEGDEKNELVSKIMDEEINGRCFLCCLMPQYYRKYVNINKNMLELFVKICENATNMGKVKNKMGDNNIVKNPFQLYNEILKN